ncbi:MYO5B protein, partial [Anhinga anhinga]|nr:MYO5B protein [Anhinga anhinga]
PFLRLLEAQLQDQRRKHEEEVEALKSQLNVMKEEMEKQQQASRQPVLMSPEAMGAVGFQSVPCVSDESLNLKELLQSLAENEKKLKKQVKIYMKVLQDLEDDAAVAGIGRRKRNMQVAVQRRGKGFRGMLEYHIEDEPRLIQNLIL